jgi:hypothetical protein
MSSTTLHTYTTVLRTYTTTSRIGSLGTPSNSYIMTVVFIGIIVLILMYFCISENSRNVMITLFYWLCLLIVKIIMLVPALLGLLYCYTYKAFVFIAQKIKKKPRIEIVLHTIVVVPNTDSSTDVSIDTPINTPIDCITHTIDFILKCYTIY